MNQSIAENICHVSLLPFYKHQMIESDHKNIILSVRSNEYTSINDRLSHLHNGAVQAAIDFFYREYLRVEWNYAPAAGSDGGCKREYNNGDIDITWCRFWP